MSIIYTCFETSIGLKSRLVNSLLPSQCISYRRLELLPLIMVLVILHCLTPCLTVILGYSDKFPNLNWTSLTSFG